ncbi:HTTM domain-containing protein [Balneola vulgaris]|uniref:HTTM domain-containing protein n=1 Tax=Balneola vulgaris TaxID=287535 RepID=UPI000361F6ED|nr:HTTM domain-containing protein [Balneola vulgaris]
MNRSAVATYFQRTTSAAPLAVFRILFGIMMLWSIIRFATNGWIQKLYIEPTYFFSYYGFEWVKPLGSYTYLLFILCGLSTIGITLGYRYRASILLFFLSFTYIELMDKTTYLNHYYFISVLSFLMIWLPANAHFSLDAKRIPELRVKEIPQWCVDAIKLLIGIVYFYAGLAKLNSDWLFKAMPLQIWLPAKYDIPLLGSLFQQEWTHYAFSWAGAIYDLSIPFLLLWKRTRAIAFILVITFHVLTGVLFPIGMFPYIMIASATIFFSPELHERVLAKLRKGTSFLKIPKAEQGSYAFSSDLVKKTSLGVVSVLLIAQLLIPFRFLLYPGNLYWTEEGYRFSWRVMLMEKAGYANFKVVDPETGRQFYIDNSRFLTSFQEKQMATQPDFILEYAYFLEDYYKNEGIKDPQIYVESYVALNGRSSQPYVDPNVDLTTITPSLKHRTWILPFND